MQHLRIVLYEFRLFGLKQASACLFGAYLLFWILLTRLWYPLDSLIHRYDFLLLCAVGFQVVLLAFRLETRREAMVIAAFHLVATAMEVFKTSEAIRAWHYPDEFVVGIYNVPLITS